MKRIVITGGSHSGKTTLVKALERQGKPVIHEAAIDVIAYYNKKLGLENQVKWRRFHQTAYHSRVDRLQRLREARAIRNFGNQAVYLDRSRLDAIAYLKYFNDPSSQGLINATVNYELEKVFMLEQIPAFNQRNITGRRSSEKNNFFLTQILRETYVAAGHKLIHVPAMDVNARLEFVLTEVLTSVG